MKIERAAALVLCAFCFCFPNHALFMAFLVYSCYCVSTLLPRKWRVEPIGYDVNEIYIIDHANYQSLWHSAEDVNTMTHNKKTCPICSLVRKDQIQRRDVAITQVCTPSRRYEIPRLIEWYTPGLVILASLALPVYLVLYLIKFSLFLGSCMMGSAYNVGVERWPIPVGLRHSERRYLVREAMARAQEPVQAVPQMIDVAIDAPAEFFEEDQVIQPDVRRLDDEVDILVELPQAEGLDYDEEFIPLEPAMRVALRVRRRYLHYVLGPPRQIIADWVMQLIAAMRLENEHFLDDPG